MWNNIVGAGFNLPQRIYVPYLPADSIRPPLPVFNPPPTITSKQIVKNFRNDRANFFLRDTLRQKKL